MASEQRLRTANKQQTQLLPGVVETEEQSLLVVKKLLAIAVSTITYLRGLFPEKAYGSKFVEEQKVLILRDEKSCPGAKQIVQWMHGCFDALQKKYLRVICLSIYTDPENPQKVTECYMFNVTYTEDGPQMEFESKSGKTVSQMSCSNNIKKASILLVRKLYTLMQHLGPLPDSVCLSMSLKYYDDVTPQEYEPPGFKEGSSDGVTFEKECVKLTVGNVVTPFHTLLLDVTTERDRLEQIDDTEPVTFRDQLEVRMSKEEEVSKTSTTQQSNMLQDSDGPENTVKIETSEEVSFQRKKRQCGKKLDLSPGAEAMETEVAMEEVVTRTTRSGRVTRSLEKKPVEPLPAQPKEKKKPKPVQNQEMSQLEFPLSQDPQPTKKRKFSQPKQCFDAKPREG
ncbi:HORMA domain-containing protein 1 [Engraulis encrasicolus]|uniref:HORMA domain-containing protein 1 n=1 Tax=Engraulis encrasicolus TaxID=184585 RepID=UPI002FCF39D0